MAESWHREVKIQDRAYDSGWSDMREVAAAICEAAGRFHLAALIRNVGKPMEGED